MDISFIYKLELGGKFSCIHNPLLNSQIQMENRKDSSEKVLVLMSVLLLTSRVTLDKLLNAYEGSAPSCIPFLVAMLRSWQTQFSYICLVAFRLLVGLQLLVDHLGSFSLELSIAWRLYFHVPHKALSTYNIRNKQ